MSGDRELLEMAAKATASRIVYGKDDDDAAILMPNSLYVRDERGQRHLWNPLTDDGDALRLAVKLGLRVFTPDAEPTAVADRYPCGPRAGVDAGVDSYAATRRAIVRAAAEIGKAKP